MQYCVGVVDQSMDSKRLALEAETEDPATKRRMQGALYAEEVKVRRMYFGILQSFTESDPFSAIRFIMNRVLSRLCGDDHWTVSTPFKAFPHSGYESNCSCFSAFRSRCKYFEPPLTDADARRWWDAARAGR